jgi:hypothetical protein
MFALLTRRTGKTVTLIERDQSFGGAWATETVKLGHKELAHERACHLIEWYVGGYAILEDISGIDFEILDPQPVRVWKSGRVAPYTTRFGIFSDYVKLWRSLLFSIAKIGLSFLRIVELAPEDVWDQLNRVFAKLKTDTFHRLPGSITFDGVRGPTGGFSRFSIRLWDKLKDEGIVIFEGNASQVLEAADHTPSVTVGNSKIAAKVVAVGESTIIGNLARDFSMTRYCHFLVSVPADKTIIRNSYVYYPDHELFYRTAYLEDATDENGIPVAIFLIQSRKQPAEIRDLKSEFARVQEIYRFVSSVERFKILKVMENEYIASQSHSGWKHGDPSRVLVVKTVGDLSRNALLLKKSFARAPLIAP